MLEVSSTVQFDFPTLRQLEGTAVKALEQTADALLTEIKNAEVMPFDTGAMQNDNTFADTSYSAQGVVSIVITSPYARRLYYHPEYNFRRDNNIAAGGKWLEPWLPGGTRQNFCQEAFQKIYKELNRL